MKDRFRFRAWNKEEKKMYYDAQDTYDYMTGNPVIFAESFGCLLSNDEEWEVEQCTGLSDKNGNLIYEGDVVRGEKEIGTVKYGKHPRTNSHSIELGFYIDWEMKHPWRSDICYWTSPENPDCIEIIGNIHEQKDKQ